MKVTIDRFEGDFAVVELENRQTANMPKILVPKGAKEGDVLDIEIDEKSTDNKKKEIEKLMNEVWEN